jgi:hypothetical protein
MLLSGVMGSLPVLSWYRTAAAAQRGANGAWVARTGQMRRERGTGGANGAREAHGRRERGMGGANGAMTARTGQWRRERGMGGANGATAAQTGPLLADGCALAMLRCRPLARASFDNGAPPRPPPGPAAGLVARTLVRARRRAARFRAPLVVASRSFARTLVRAGAPLVFACGARALAARVPPPDPLIAPGGLGTMSQATRTLYAVMVGGQALARDQAVSLAPLPSLALRPPLRLSPCCSLPLPSHFCRAGPRSASPCPLIPALPPCRGACPPSLSARRRPFSRGARYRTTWSRYGTW